MAIKELSCIIPRGNLESIHIVQGRHISIRTYKCNYFELFQMSQEKIDEIVIELKNKSRLPIRFEYTYNVLSGS